MTYEDPGGITRTLRSLESLRAVAHEKIEIIVQDGSSAQLTEYDAHISARCEPDHGIYDAMNKGLARSTGAFVWFLNGGDENIIDDWESLERELSVRSEHLILCDFELKFNSKTILRQSRKPEYIWHGLPTSHQAIFYPGQRARAVGYDLSYEVAADYALTSTLYSACVPVYRFPVAVARFYTGGTSQTRAKQIAADAARVQRDILGSSLASRSLSLVRHTLTRWLRQGLSFVWGIAEST